MQQLQGGQSSKLYYRGIELSLRPSQFERLFIVKPTPPPRKPRTQAEWYTPKRAYEMKRLATRKPNVTEHIEQLRERIEMAEATMTQEPWTEAEDEFLRTKTLEGWDDVRMAERLHRSEEAIRNRRARKGYKRTWHPNSRDKTKPTQSEIHRETILEMRRTQGLPFAQIAKQLGVSKNTVVGVWHNHGKRATASG